MYDLLLLLGMKGLKTTCILSFLLFVSVTAISTIANFLKFSNRTAGIYLQTLWYYSLHWLHCAISYLSSVAGTYDMGRRHYNSMFEIAIAHVTTSPVIVGNGVSFPIFRH